MPIHHCVGHAPAAAHSSSAARREGLFSVVQHAQPFGLDQQCKPVVVCVRVALPRTVLHDEYVFALLHAAIILDAPLLLRR